MSLYGTKRRQRIRGELPVRLYWRIGEIATWLGVETYIIRYWEKEFAVWLRVARAKPRSGNPAMAQRVYSQHQAGVLSVIRELLYTELYTIAGAKRQLRLAAERGKEAG